MHTEWQRPHFRMQLQLCYFRPSTRHKGPQQILQKIKFTTNDNVTSGLVNLHTYFLTISKKIIEYQGSHRLNIFRIDISVQHFNYIAIYRDISLKIIYNISVKRFRFAKIEIVHCCAQIRGTVHFITSFVKKNLNKLMFMLLK